MYKQKIDLIFAKYKSIIYTTNKHIKCLPIAHLLRLLKKRN